MEQDKLTKRFIRYSPDALTDEELLELLLRYTGENAAQQAQSLLVQFRSIHALFDADLQQLTATDGVAFDAAMLLRLVSEMQRRYFLSRVPSEQRLLTASDYGQYLLPYFLCAKNEMVYLLCLDGAGKPLNCRKLGEGGVNSANVPIRNMIQEALTVNATGVVLAHNHPSEIALPSRQDVELTLRLKSALEIMRISLLDHVIFADDDFVSMRESGVF